MLYGIKLPAPGKIRDIEKLYCPDDLLKVFTKCYESLGKKFFKCHNISRRIYYEKKRCYQFCRKPGSF